MTLTTVKGDQPLGTYALTGHDAESGAASGAKGVRYNEGWVGMAGDGAPGPLALGHAGAQTTRSGKHTLLLHALSGQLVQVDHS